jgi:hypothetical protein
MTSTDSIPAVRSLHHEQIEPDQIEDALGPLDAAARWLIERGIEQWPPSFSESPERSRKLIEEAEAGNVFVWYTLGRPVATATITSWQDPDFGPAWLDQTLPAQYLMRFAVSQTGRRLIPGLGARILDFALFLAETRGAHALRLDCSKSNERLHRYYFEHGFDRVGTVDLSHRKSGALFEKRIH